MLWYKVGSVHSTINSVCETIIIH